MLCTFRISQFVTNFTRQSQLQFFFIFLRNLELGLDEPETFGGTLGGEKPRRTFRQTDRQTADL